MNYVNTFIEVADDSPARTASVPTHKGDKKTIGSYDKHDPLLLPNW
jgi:hypothetical protein